MLVGQTYRHERQRSSWGRGTVPRSSLSTTVLSRCFRGGGREGTQPSILLLFLRGPPNLTRIPPPRTNPKNSSRLAANAHSPGWVDSPPPIFGSHFSRAFPHLPPGSFVVSSYLWFCCWPPSLPRKRRSSALKPLICCCCCCCWRMLLRRRHSVAAAAAAAMLSSAPQRQTRCQL